MYCKNCGKEILNEAVICPSCGYPTDNYNKINAKNNTELITASKIFIILSIVAASIGILTSIVFLCMGYFLLILAIIALCIPIIIGYFAFKKLNKAKSRQEIFIISILTLVFCNIIAGILMLCISDKDF